MDRIGVESRTGGDGMKRILYFGRMSEAAAHIGWLETQGIWNKVTIPVAARSTGLRDLKAFLNRPGGRQK